MLSLCLKIDKVAKDIEKSLIFNVLDFIGLKFNTTIFS